MNLFRRDNPPAPPNTGTVPPPPDEDGIAMLTEQVHRLERQINSHAGQLPLAAVPQARRITDTLLAGLRTASDDHRDVNARVMIGGIGRDYLPTTLERFCGLDRHTTSVANAQGRTPVDSLLEQLDSLEGAAVDVLAALRHDDVDSLTTQGNFLKTKFTRSDLDL